MQRPKDEARAVAAQFGSRVREHRERLPRDEGGKAVSQERLATMAGFHRTYIGHVERGEVNPALWNIVRLAAALQVDPAVLVRGLTPSPS